MKAESMGNATTPEEASFDEQRSAVYFTALYRTEILPPAAAR